MSQNLARPENLSATAPVLICNPAPKTAELAETPAKTPKFAHKAHAKPYATTALPSAIALVSISIRTLTTAEAAVPNANPTPYAPSVPAVAHALTNAATPALTSKQTPGTAATADRNVQLTKYALRENA